MKSCLMSIWQKGAPDVAYRRTTQKFKVANVKKKKNRHDYMKINSGKEWKGVFLAT